jgi:hypothetical protein
VRVAVVDTGFLQGWESRFPWLSGITEYDVDDPDVLEPRGYIDPYAGHGTFIAGVVRCMAPSAEVTVDRSVEMAGVIDEASLVMQIGDALARSPDVISVSAGGYTRNNLPPKALTALWEQRLRHHKGVAFVAAAGNNDTRHPFWPAAFPWAVSVGALTADGRERAEFSNHGGWVDVYAPGVDIVNAYCEGEYRLLLDRSVVRTFDGMCKWSGTSFSTPIVAGLIAARMSRTGENGRQAADGLLEAARSQFVGRDSQSLPDYPALKRRREEPVAAAQKEPGRDVRPSAQWPRLFKRRRRLAPYPSGHRLSHYVWWDVVEERVQRVVPVLGGPAGALLGFAYGLLPASVGPPFARRLAWGWNHRGDQHQEIHPHPFTHQGCGEPGHGLRDQNQIGARADRVDHDVGELL